MCSCVTRVCLSAHSDFSWLYGVTGDAVHAFLSTFSLGFLTARQPVTLNVECGCTAGSSEVRQSVHKSAKSSPENRKCRSSSQPHWEPHTRK